MLSDPRAFFDYRIQSTAFIFLKSSLDSFILESRIAIGAILSLYQTSDTNDLKPSIKSYRIGLTIHRIGNVVIIAGFPIRSRSSCGTSAYLPLQVS